MACIRSEQNLSQIKLTVYGLSSAKRCWSDYFNKMIMIFTYLGSGIHTLVFHEVIARPLKFSHKVFSS